LFVFFYQFVTNLIEFYPELFDGEGGDASQYQANFTKKWGSYSTIYELAKGDILKFDEITKLPLDKCLLMLCYIADKNFLDTLTYQEANRRIVQ
jgi:hypothetical protein